MAVGGAVGLALRLSHKHLFFRARTCVQIVRNVTTDYPPPPKRAAMSSYMNFGMEKRPDILRDNPGLKSVDVIRKIAEMWRFLPDDERQPYMAKGEEARMLYKQQMEEYLQSLTAEQKEQLKKDKKNRRKVLENKRIKSLTKKFNKPVKPANSFFLFAMSQSSTKSGSLPESQERFKHLAETWKNMSAEEKKAYAEEAAALRESYQMSLEEWEGRMLEEGHPELVRQKNPLKKRLKIRKKAVAKTKKKATRKKKAKKSTSAKTKRKKSTSAKTKTKKSISAETKAKSSTQKTSKKKTATVDEDVSWMRDE